MNKKSILVVDDDVSIQEIIVCYLGTESYSITTASNGKEALDILEHSHPDLILCDLKMPIIDGLKFLEIYKAKDSDTPVVVISAVIEFTDAINALRLGAWDYIIKPFSKDVLLHSVSKALEHHRIVKENRKQRVELEKSLAQLKEDQESGKNVQQMLLPINDHEFKNFTLSHRVLPSLYLSGDFVDYFKINENQLGFYIADVSGHGASSAFITVLLKSLVEQILSNYHIGIHDNILNPANLLKYVSDDILEAKLGKYLTMFYCVIDISKNTLTYSIGGHYPSPIIWDGKQLTFLKGIGFPVGITTNPKYENFTINLPDNFAMILFSDGIFDVMHGKDLNHKENILLSAINPFLLSIDSILSHLNISNDQQLPDDITILLIKKNQISGSRYDSTA